jgi:hypothetical protein
MRNETHAEIIEDIIAVVKLIGAGSLGLTALLAELEKLVAFELALFEYILKSGLTAKLEELDHDRDEILRALALAIEALLHHPVLAKREAGVKLDLIIKHYGRIARKSYDDESAVINDLLRELELAINKALIALAGLTDVVNELKATNDTFIATMRARSSEVAQHPTARMKEAREATDKVILDMLERVEAQVTLYGLTSTSSDYAPFVAEWNALAERYNHRLALERGRRASKKEGEEL